MHLSCIPVLSQAFVTALPLLLQFFIPFSYISHFFKLLEHWLKRKYKCLVSLTTGVVEQIEHLGYLSYYIGSLKIVEHASH